MTRFLTLLLLVGCAVQEPQEPPYYNPVAWRGVPYGFDDLDPTHAWGLDGDILVRTVEPECRWSPLVCARPVVCQYGIDGTVLVSRVFSERWGCIQ